MFKIYAVLAIVGIIAAAGTGAVVYVNRLHNQINTLQVNNATLESVVRTQQETIKQTLAKAKQVEQLNTRLQIDLTKATAGIDQLRQKLANHDLTRLVLAKPGLIETRINNATEELFRQLQADTANPSLVGSSTAQ